MADDFDRSLAAALEPTPGLPDRQFVAGVQRRILLEDGLSAQRRQLVASLVSQLLALVAVAGAAWWIGRAPPVARMFGEAPWLGLLVLLAAFSFVVVLFSSLGRPTLRGLR